MINLLKKPRHVIENRTVIGFLKGVVSNAYVSRYD